MNHDGAQINITLRNVHHVGAFLFLACTKRTSMRQQKNGICEANHPIFSASQSLAGAPTRHLSACLKVS